MFEQLLQNEVIQIVLCLVIAALGLKIAKKAVKIILWLACAAFIAFKVFGLSFF